MSLSLILAAYLFFSALPVQATNIGWGNSEVGIDPKGNIWFARQLSNYDPIVISKYDFDGNVLFLNKKVAYPPESAAFQDQTDTVKRREYGLSGLGMAFDAEGDPLLFWRLPSREPIFQQDPNYDKIRVVSLTAEGMVRADTVFPDIHCTTGLNAFGDSSGRLHIVYGSDSHLSGYLRVERQGKQIRVLKHLSSPALESYARLFSPVLMPCVSCPFSFLAMDGEKVLVCAQPRGDWFTDSLLVYRLSLQMHPLPRGRKDLRVGRYGMLPDDEIRNLLKGKMVNGGIGLFDFSNFQAFQLSDHAFRKYPGAVFPATDLVQAADGNYIFSARANDEKGIWAVYQIRLDPDGNVLKPAKLELAEPKSLTTINQVIRLQITLDTKPGYPPLPQNGMVYRSAMVYGFDTEGNLYYKPCNLITPR